LELKVIAGENTEPNQVLLEWEYVKMNKRNLEI